MRNDVVKVRDIMNSELAPVTPDTPVIEVAHRMKVSGTGVIPVCNSRRFQGLVSERDIVSTVANAIDPVTEPAHLAMSSHCPFISPDEDLMQATRIMVENGVSMLPVLQNGKLVGLLSAEDLARESPALAGMVLAKTLTLGLWEDKGKIR